MTNCCNSTRLNLTSFLHQLELHNFKVNYKMCPMLANTLTAAPTFCNTLPSPFSSHGKVLCALCSQLRRAFLPMWVSLRRQTKWRNSESGCISLQLICVLTNQKTCNKSKQKHPLRSTTGWGWFLRPFKTAYISNDWRTIFRMFFMEISNFFLTVHISVSLLHHCDPNLLKNISSQRVSGVADKLKATSNNMLTQLSALKHQQLVTLDWIALSDPSTIL